MGSKVKRELPHEQAVIRRLGGGFEGCYFVISGLDQCSNKVPSRKKKRKQPKGLEFVLREILHMVIDSIKRCFTLKQQEDFYLHQNENQQNQPWPRPQIIAVVILLPGVFSLNSLLL